jgi:hypothetical protein
MPPGGPRMFATPYPMEIIQSPETKRIWMVFEGGTHVWREIHMDGRAHPKNDTIKGLTWLGDSVGKWEGDTLVVDVVNFQEGTWLDYAGHPHTDQLHVVERFTRPNKGTLHYEALIDDPAPTQSHGPFSGTSIGTQPANSRSTSARKTTCT